MILTGFFIILVSALMRYLSLEDDVSYFDFAFLISIKGPHVCPILHDLT